MCYTNRCNKNNYNSEIILRNKWQCEKPYQGTYLCFGEIKKDGAGALLTFKIKERRKEMTFEYESKIYLGEVAIYVADLAGQSDFYQRVLGLELLE